MIQRWENVNAHDQIELRNIIWKKCKLIMMIGKNQLVKKHLSCGFYYFVKKKLQFFSLNDVNYHFCKVKRCLFSFINQIAIFIGFRNTININICKKYKPCQFTFTVARWSDTYTNLTNSYYLYSNEPYILQMVKKKTKTNQTHQTGELYWNWYIKIHLNQIVLVVHFEHWIYHLVKICHSSRVY